MSEVLPMLVSMTDWFYERAVRRPRETPKLARYIPPRYRVSEYTESHSVPAEHFHRDYRREDLCVGQSEERKEILRDGRPFELMLSVQDGRKPIERNDHLNTTRHCDYELQCERDALFQNIPRQAAQQFDLYASKRRRWLDEALDDWASRRIQPQMSEYRRRFSTRAGKLREDAEQYMHWLDRLNTDGPDAEQVDNVFFGNRRVAFVDAR